MAAAQLSSCRVATLVGSRRHGPYRAARQQRQHIVAAVHGEQAGAPSALAGAGRTRPSAAAAVTLRRVGARGSGLIASSAAAAGPLAARPPLVLLTSTSLLNVPRGSPSNRPCRAPLLLPRRHARGGRRGRPPALPAALDAPRGAAGGCAGARRRPRGRSLRLRRPQAAHAAPGPALPPPRLAHRLPGHAAGAGRDGADHSRDAVPAVQGPHQAHVPVHQLHRWAGAVQAEVRARGPGAPAPRQPARPRSPAAACCRRLPARRRVQRVGVEVARACAHLPPPPLPLSTRRHHPRRRRDGGLRD